MMRGVSRAKGYRVLLIRALARGRLVLVMLMLSSCVPLSNSDNLINPAGDDTLGGNVVDESSWQSWRAPTTPRDQLTTLFPFEATTYSFSADGALQRLEFIPRGALSGPALFGGSFEVTNTIIPVGIETEILRLTFSDSAGVTGEDRTFLQFAEGSLTIAPDGAVTFAVDSTYRDELYSSNPTMGIENSLVYITTVQGTQVTTGRLSEDGVTIEWMSVSGEKTTTQTGGESPPWEITAPIDHLYEEGEVPPWTLVAKE